LAAKEKTLTREQQDQVVGQLDKLYIPVYLKCDGYLIEACMSRVGKNEIAIVVYVNGSITFKWGRDRTDEALRFWRPSTRAKYSPKFVKGMERALGKRRCKAEGYYEKVTIYRPYWMRPRPFLRHILKTCDDVELLTFEEYREQLNAKRAQQADDNATQESEQHARA